jgi:hypothetical protein
MARPPKSGVQSSIKPDELAAHVIEKLTHNIRDWLPLLRQLLKEYQARFGPLPNKSLTTIGRDHLKIVLQSISKGTPLTERERLMAEIAALWARHEAEHEQAVINGDGAWFQRQAKAAAKSPRPTAIGRFHAAVVRELNWRALLHGGKPHLFLLGGHTGCINQDILDVLEQREEKSGSKKHLIVEGRRFQSARRARAEVTKIAKHHHFQLP